MDIGESGHSAIPRGGYFDTVDSIKTSVAGSFTIAAVGDLL
ncbi:hypothetical protein J2Z31_005539 [Sinorhizobium kostiense]|uniref:Uncharacterized protein n=1 Tax=Sinorhizobium kostiense TaxID=76747 RepID=A0ABS4R7Y7_9HYPH|nr:hypothetical protein [Sinorhizobium kostiense]